MEMDQKKRSYKQGKHCKKWQQLMTAWMGNRDEHNNRCMRDVLGYINSMELALLTRFHCRFKGKSSLLSFPNSTPKTHFSPQILQSLKMLNTTSSLQSGSTNSSISLSASSVGVKSSVSVSIPTTGVQPISWASCGRHRGYQGIRMRCRRRLHKRFGVHRRC